MISTLKPAKSQQPFKKPAMKVMKKPCSKRDDADDDAPMVQNTSNSKKADDDDDDWQMVDIMVWDEKEKRYRPDVKMMKASDLNEIFKYPQEPETTTMKPEKAMKKAMKVMKKKAAMKAMKVKTKAKAQLHEN